MKTDICSRVSFSMVSFSPESSRVCTIIIFLTTVACLLSSSDAYQFIVGGKDGWTLNPKESYNHWAERMRFQVNDTLLFKYKNGSDSVLVVNKSEYEQCKTDDRSIAKLEDGNSIFKFDRSGPFFFISGNESNCYDGQKLIIVVLAVRTRPDHPVLSPAPAPQHVIASSPSPDQWSDAPSDQNSTQNNNPPEHKHSFGIRDCVVSTFFVVIITLAVSFVLNF